MEETRRRELERDFQRLQGGDRSALEPAFRILFPIVRSFAARLLSPAESEDAAQLTLEKVFARIDQYDAGRPVLPWVLAIAEWECRTLRQRTRRRKEDTDVTLEKKRTEDESPEGNAARHEELQQVFQAMGELSETDRLALREFFFDHDEVADANARKRKQRALERLRLVVRRLYGW